MLAWYQNCETLIIDIQMVSLEEDATPLMTFNVTCVIVSLTLFEAYARLLY